MHQCSWGTTRIIYQHNLFSNIPEAGDASGLVVNPTHPYLGVSPDSVVSYSCFGEGLPNIKWIWDRNSTTVTEGNFYLKVIDECLQLSKRNNSNYLIRANLHCAITPTVTSFVELRMECTLNKLPIMSLLGTKCNPNYMPSLWKFYSQRFVSTTAQLKQ